MEEQVQSEPLYTLVGGWEPRAGNWQLHHLSRVLMSHSHEEQVGVRVQVLCGALNAWWWERGRGIVVGTEWEGAGHQTPGSAHRPALPIHFRLWFERLLQCEI